MIALNNLAGRFTAAATALALSLVLFSNTLSVPQASLVSTTYVGEVA